MVIPNSDTSSSSSCSCCCYCCNLRRSRVALSTELDHPGMTIVKILNEQIKQKLGFWFPPKDTRLEREGSKRQSQEAQSYYIKFRTPTPTPRRVRKTSSACQHCGPESFWKNPESFCNKVNIAPFSL